MEEIRPSRWRYVVKLTLLNLFTSFCVSLTGVARGAPIWLTTVTFGLSITLAVLLIGWLVPKMRHRSFVLTVIGQGLAIGLSMGSGFLLALVINVVYGARGAIFQADTWQSTWRIVSSPEILQYVFFSMILAFAISGILQFSRKLGPGVLWNWITGKYHEPREEERIFMFLDLKDSTTVAEKLGAKPFSSLVRDFFQDLTEPCQLTSAEVSHYIGDEAVISWRPKNGLKDANCVRMYFLFGRAIAKRAAYYQTKYGVVPEYKAGIHIGAVVATEVGDAKSEIVFHGDVMNTTARIQGLCNETGAELLISGDLAGRLEGALGAYRVASLGLKALKGRMAPIEVFSVEKV